MRWAGWRDRLASLSSIVAGLACGWVGRCVVAGTLLAAATARAAAEPGRTTVLLVVGAPGEPQFGRDFDRQVATWKRNAAAASADLVVIGDDAPAEPAASDRERLKQALAGQPQTGPDELWLILIGHGTFDGTEAKFNLRGPDVSAADLSEWLKPFHRPIAVIDTSSASAPFLAALTAPNRVVVTSTRSGFEQNYARFGGFFADAIAGEQSDLDKDGQVSLLEAFLMAARRTAEYYRTEGRLATEHPLIDDNGDGLGTPADWFRGVRATRRARDGAELDGARSRRLCLVRSAAERQLPPAMRARRDEIELEVEKLRDAKATMPDQEYYGRLEKLMLELAAVYDGT